MKRKFKTFSKRVKDLKKGTILLSASALLLSLGDSQVLNIALDNNKIYVQKYAHTARAFHVKISCYE